MVGKISCNSSWIMVWKKFTETGFSKLSFVFGNIPQNAVFEFF